MYAGDGRREEARGLGHGVAALAVGRRGAEAVSTRHHHLSAAGREHAPPSPVRKHESCPPRECPTRIGLRSNKKEGSLAVTSIRLCAWTSKSIKSRTTWTRKATCRLRVRRR